MAARPQSAYEGDEPYVFVSYSHVDDDLVYPEIRWLQDQGINVWYDEGISGASRWRDAIARHLGGCRLLLYFVTPSSVASQVCRDELEYVLDLELARSVECAGQWQVAAAAAELERDRKLQTRLHDVIAKR